MKEHKGLDDLEIYRLAMEIGEEVWKLVSEWAWLEKKHPGIQYTEAADSIAANISEGYGRFYFKETRHFCFIARGSLSETRTWTSKSFNRELITASQHQCLMDKIVCLHKKLNNYINWLEAQIANNKDKPNP